VEELKNRIGLLICNSTSQKITPDPVSCYGTSEGRGPRVWDSIGRDDVLEGIRMYRVFALLDLNVCFHGFRTSILDEKSRLEFVLSSLGYGSSCVKFRSLRLRGGRCLVAVVAAAVSFNVGGRPTIALQITANQVADTGSATPENCGGKKMFDLTDKAYRTGHPSCATS
jgi:hypothetical protein